MIIRRVFSTHPLSPAEPRIIRTGTFGQIKMGRTALLASLANAYDIARVGRLRLIICQDSVNAIDKYADL